MLAGVGAGVAVLGNALKAAAEDEAEQKKLAQTIMNVAEGTLADVAATEKWIDAKQRATGVADSELRPALDNLLRGTGSLELSTKLLNIAMDVAAGTGKDLETVSYALSAAYAGNMRGLQALSPEMKALIKDGMTADEAFAHLSATFKDQASTQAETMQGKMARLKISLDEASESLGMALMPWAIKFADWLTETIPKVENLAGDISDWWAKQDGLKEAIKGAGEQLKDFIEDIKTLVGWIKDAVEWTQKLIDKINSIPGVNNSLLDIDKKTPGPRIPADKGLIDWITGKAAGGPVSGGRPYVVGERGPELFVPGSSGGIVPNHALGGGSQVINIVVDGKVLASAVVDASNKAGGLPIRIRAAT